MNPPKRIRIWPGMAGLQPGIWGVDGDGPESFMLTRYVRNDVHEEAIKAAYLAGFMASGEGWNGEYPFTDKALNPAEDGYWLGIRENELAAITRKGGAE